MAEGKKGERGRVVKKRRKIFINLFFTSLAVTFSLSPIIISLQSKADETTDVPGVLGRTVRLNALCDDFEDTNWYFDYEKHGSNNGFWRGFSGRGEPELLTRITTPDGGKSGSTGALEIRTNKIDNDSSPYQEDFLTADFEQRLGRELTKADQPVFIVHVWLPPFDQWGNYYSFGFRHEWYPSNSDNDKCYSTIWLRYEAPYSRPNLVFRIQPTDAKSYYEIDGGPISQPGWWTLAIAFDENGVDRYYICPGVNIPTEKDIMLDTTQLRTKNGAINLFMDRVRYSFFSLGYPINGNTSPRFIIDDYEIWVIKNSK